MLRVLTTPFVRRTTSTVMAVEAVTVMWAFIILVIVRFINCVLRRHWYSSMARMLCLGGTRRYPAQDRIQCVLQRVQLCLLRLNGTPHICHLDPRIAMKKPDQTLHTRRLVQLVWYST